MDKNEILKETAERLDDMIKLKGVLEWLDGMVLNAALKAGYNALENWSPEVASEFLQTCESFNNLDFENMVDEGADLIAEIVKKLWLSQFV